MAHDRCGLLNGPRGQVLSVASLEHRHRDDADRRPRRDRQPRDRPRRTAPPGRGHPERDDRGQVAEGDLAPHCAADESRSERSVTRGGRLWRVRDDPNPPRQQSRTAVDSGAPRVSASVIAAPPEHASEIALTRTRRVGSPMHPAAQQPTAPRPIRRTIHRHPALGRQPGRDAMKWRCFPTSVELPTYGPT
jgi:hypothetical protein